MQSYEEEIIEFLKNRGDESTLNEIGEALQLDPITQVYPICKTLKNAGRIQIEGRNIKLIVMEGSGKPDIPKDSATEDLRQFSPEAEPKVPYSAGSVDTQANQLAQVLIQAIQQITRQSSSIGEDQTSDEWELVKESIDTDIEQEVDKYKPELIIKPAQNDIKPKKLIGIPTKTLLDNLFLDYDGNPLGGVPIVGQFAITGLPGAGKSILMEEIALHIAAQGKKVLYMTSEDQWFSNTQRMDLNSRMYQKAKILGYDWNKISPHLVILDSITYSELRKWDILIATYRYIVEKEHIDVAIFDSVTVLESYRGALKFRVMELARYNQVQGVTCFFVNQRRAEMWDSYEMAGGIGIPHVLDGTIIIDYGRIYHPDQEIELQLRRGIFVNILRVLDCRLSGFVRERQRVVITPQGFVRLIDQEQLQEEQVDYEALRVKKDLKKPLVKTSTNTTVEPTEINEEEQSAEIEQLKKKKKLRL